MIRGFPIDQRRKREYSPTLPSSRKSRRRRTSDAVPPQGGVPLQSFHYQGIGDGKGRDYLRFLGVHTLKGKTGFQGVNVVNINKS
jgi:hypothetical protein